MSFVFMQNRVVLRVPLELNQVRLNVIQKRLASSLPVVRNGKPHIVFENPESGVSLSIAPGQIMVDVKADAEGPDFKSVAHIIRDLFDTLLLEEKVEWIVDHIAIGEFEGRQADKKSLQLLKADSHRICAGLPHLTGVGLRFLFEEESLNGEFKLEPLVRDPSQYWAQLLLRGNTETEIEGALAQGENWHSVMRTQVLPEAVKEIIEREP